MLFRCLAERAPSGQYVRRPIRVQEVAKIAGCSDAAVIDVVDVFRRDDRSFLVPPVGVTLTADSMLDISHEALIRQWQRLGGQSEQPGEHASAQSWLEIEEQSRRRYRRLAEAAENEHTAGLLRNPEMDFLNQWWEAFQPTPAWAEACVKKSFERTPSFSKRSLAEAAAENAARDADQVRRKAEDQQRIEMLQNLAEAERAKAEAERQKANKQRLATRMLIGFSALAVGLAAFHFTVWPNPRSV
ncbi:MAG: hypothetical protein NTY19_05185 [Planctomycetota bacterium]|nr:hypothetical protein [Planctomycetota bacterium]